VTAIILDTESSGLDSPRLVEVAWVEVSLQLVTGAKFYQRYNPQKPIEFGALATHHIMDEDLVDCPPYTDFKLPDGVEYLIGYNIDYDWGVIGEPPVKRICMLALCRYLWPQLDSHSQSAVLYYLNRPKARELLKSAHSAEADVMNCMRILWRVLQVLEPQEKESWEALWKTSEIARIPTVMMFGKHKGASIKDIPWDYKQWLLKQPDVDPYLAMALRGEAA
jgi:exodeoxyribonuclease X